MSAQELITDHLHLWTGAVKKKSTSGRGSNGKIELTGIKKLRELILELAVRGKLVEQNPEEQPAQLVLERINQEVERQVNAGQRKKPKPTSLISDDEVPFQTPDNWIWARLGALCELENGDRSKNYPNKSALVATGIPFVNAGHIRNYEVNQDEMTFISEDRFNLLRSGKFREGDILFCLRGSLGKVGIVKGLTQGAIASSLIIARPILQHSEYLLLYLKAPLAAKMVKQYDNGTAQPNLSGKDFGSFLVPVPPEDEQNRIVQKVDELMALCDRLEQQTSDQIEAHETLVDTLLGTLTQSQNATELAENWPRLAAHFDTLFTTEQSIDKLKQTILQLAVMGRLVEQNPGDKPAHSLRRQIAETKEQLIQSGSLKKQKPIPSPQSGSIPFKIPTSWETVAFGEITFNRDAERIPVSVEERRKRSGIFDYYGASGVIDSIDDYLFDSPLLLIGEDGANLINRSTPIAFIARGKYWVNNHAHVVDGVSENFLRYMCLYINAISLEPYVTGTAQPKMNQAKMNSIPVPLPPEDEQIRIIQKVDKLMALCDQLKKRLNQASETRCQLAETIVENALQ